MLGMLGQLIRLVQTCQYIFTNHFGLCCSLDYLRTQSLQHDHKFISSQPGNRVFLSHTGLQASGNFSQELITHLVAQRVIECFEMIQIQKQQRTSTATACTGSHGLLHAIG